MSFLSLITEYALWQNTCFILKYLLINLGDEYVILIWILVEIEKDTLQANSYLLMILLSKVQFDFSLLTEIVSKFCV